MYKDYAYAVPKRTNDEVPYLVVLPAFTKLKRDDTIYATDEKRTFELSCLASIAVDDDDVETLVMIKCGAREMLKGIGYAKKVKISE